MSWVVSYMALQSDLHLNMSLLETTLNTVKIVNIEVVPADRQCRVQVASRDDILWIRLDDMVRAQIVLLCANTLLETVVFVGPQILFGLHIQFRRKVKTTKSGKKEVWELRA